MKRPITTLFAGGVLALAVLGVAVAGPYEDGYAAYERGDYAAAMNYWRPLAVQGNALAQNSLGLMYRYGHGVAQDYAQGLVWFRKAAVQGDPSAQNNLGVLYQDGHGVAQDYAQALVWFRKAADQGDASAQNSLGVMYGKGQGVAQNFAQALVWFRKAADQGNADAQYNLGVRYRDGHGVAQDYAQALVWFRKAADQGDAWAQAALGDMYRHGQGVAQDYAQALVWFRKAADQGDALAQGELAEMSEAGQGVPQAASPAAEGSEIVLQKQGGIFVIPVSINNAITLNFIIDSGADDVSIPADVVMTLMRTGTLKREDFLGSQTYTLADGSQVPSEMFRIRTLKVGNKEIDGVTGNVAKIEGGLLLGQSFLTRFKSWSIDNERGVLVLKR